MDKVALIRGLMEARRFVDMRDIMEGESPYISDLSTGAPDGVAERRAWAMSQHHLRFVAEFGDLPTARKDGRILSAYPEDFETWLQFGAPGIAVEDIERYLAANPL